MRPLGSEPIIYSFNTTQGSPDDPMIFGKGVFEDSFDRVLDLMPQDTQSQKNIKEHMESIKSKISARNKNTEKISKLKDYLENLDRRRGTDWKQTFPWLVDQ